MLMENFNTNIHNSKFVPHGNGFYHIVDNVYAPNNNFGAPIAKNNSSSPLLSSTTAPSLPTAPCSKHAASCVAAGHLCSDLDTKLMENDARHNNGHPCPKEHLNIREVAD
jgi:hypothetical protein